MMENKIYMEGNNGGDVLDIKDMGDGCIRLKIGCSCVWTVDHVVPVEWLTAALTMVVEDGFDKPLKWSNWPKDFVDNLAGKIKPNK